MKLQILIPTLQARKEIFKPNFHALQTQIAACRLKDQISLVLHPDAGEKSIGQKRNELMSAATAEYVCFLDDDDPIMSNYIPSIWSGIQQGKDCVELKGIMTTNGLHPVPFHHSIKFNAYTDRNGVYLRPPNHLNPIRRELIKEFEFPSISLGEDTDWAMQICRAGVIKSEAEVPHTYYFYQYLTNK